MSALITDQPKDFVLQPWIERLYKRVQLKYATLYGVKPEPVKVPDYPQTAAYLTQAEIDKRWDDYPKKKGLSRYLKNAGANAARP